MFTFGNALAEPIDLGITNDADYDKLIGAMRAAEYVRSDVIAAEESNPRVYAVLAGVMAYAERNPNASTAQIQAYIPALDVAFQNYHLGDPNLIDRATLYAALRFTVLTDSVFSGSDTDVGERALDLIGINILEPDGFNSLERRMVGFELALGRPLNFSNEIFDLLVSGFFGVDPAGTKRPRFPVYLSSYFESEGYNPELGGERLDLPGVNEALAFLPADYLAYELMISEFSEVSNLSLRDELEIQFDDVQAVIQARVDSLASDLINAPDLINSVNNPNDVNLVLEELRAELAASTKARTAASATTYLMLQSNNAEVGEYAFTARDYSQISLETNESTAMIAAGVQIGTSLSLAYATRGLKNPSVAINQLANAAKETYGLFAEQNAPPGVDEQTFDQVVELRIQVEEMRDQMMDRFNRVDGQLNNLFEKVSDGFNAIGELVINLTSTVESISREMMLARSQLRRLEASLYGVAEAFLGQLLTVEANLALNYRDQNATDLDYQNSVPNFITATNSFFSYAAQFSDDKPFVGPHTTPAGLLADANDILSSNDIKINPNTGDAISKFLNDFIQLPVALGLPPLIDSVTPIPGIEPWSQSAAAYAQMGRENPWYFGLQYRTQLDDFMTNPGTPPKLDVIITKGERLVSFVAAIRKTDNVGRSALFDALINKYKIAAVNLQNEIDNEILTRADENNNDLTPLRFKTGSPALNYWMGSALEVSSLQGPLTLFEGTYDDISLYGTGQSGSVSPLDEGFQIFEPRNLSTTGKRLIKIWYLIQQEVFGVSFKPRLRIQWISSSTKRATLYLGLKNQPGVPARSIDFKLEAYSEFLSQWGPVTTDDIELISEGFEQIWPQRFQNPVLHADIQAGFRAPYACGNNTSFPCNDIIYQNVYEASQGSDPRFYRLTIKDEELGKQVNSADVQTPLRGYRKRVQNHLILELADNASALTFAAKELDDALALINAYVSLGMPKELTQSDVLRSALRGVAGTSEVGLGSADITSMVVKMRANDQAATGWADQNFNVKQIGNILSDRIDIIGGEIERGLIGPTFAPSYVGWVLAELKHLRATALNLATDDSYLADSNGSVTVTVILDNDLPVTGLLANDAFQGKGIEVNSPITIDTSFTPQDGYIAPTKGTVNINADGSFIYTAGPSLSGIDTFTYRTTMNIDGVGPVYSNTATVVITTFLTQSGEIIFSDSFE